MNEEETEVTGENGKHAACEAFSSLKVKKPQLPHVPQPLYHALTPQCPTLPRLNPTSPHISLTERNRRHSRKIHRRQHETKLHFGPMCAALKNPKKEIKEPRRVNPQENKGGGRGLGALSGW